MNQTSSGITPHSAQSKRRQPLLWLFGISAALSIGLVVLGPRLAQRFPWLAEGGSRGGVESFSLGMEHGNIGVITIDGVILQSLPVLDALKDFEEDGNIKGILVRLDSPGGAVGPSQEIYEQLKKLKNKKSIVVSMGSVAASGAYYIACGAHQIVASAGTLTGSIGVIMQMANLEDLYKFIKIQPFVIKAGKYKDVGSPNRKMTPEERQLLQDVINTAHLQFQKAVADGRGLPLEYVKTIADGRIFNGETAKTYGLVDVLGNFEEAVDVTARLAGVREPHLVYPRLGKFQALKEMFGSASEKFLLSLQKWRILPVSAHRYGPLFLWDGP